MRDRHYILRTVRLAIVAAAISSCAQAASAQDDWATLVDTAQLDWTHSNVSSAEDNFTRSISVADPKDPYQALWSHYYLGKSLSSEGKIQQAEEELRLASQADKGHCAAADDALIELYHYSGNESDANKLKEQAKTREGQGPDYASYMTALTSKIQQAWKPTEMKAATSTLLAWWLDQQGNVHALHVASSSGVARADQIAIKTVTALQCFGPLPANEKDACIQFSFDYNYNGQLIKRRTGARVSIVSLSDVQKSRNLDPPNVNCDLEATESKLKRCLGNDQKRALTPALLTTLSQLADCYIEEGKFVDADRTIKRILDHYKEGTADAIVAHALLRAGDLALLEQKFDQAADCYKRSVDMAEQVRPPSSAQLEESTEAYAKFLYSQVDIDEGARLYAKLRLLKQNGH